MRLKNKAMLNCFIYMCLNKILKETLTFLIACLDITNYTVENPLVSKAVNWGLAFKLKLAYGLCYIYFFLIHY